MSWLHHTSPDGPHAESGQSLSRSSDELAKSLMPVPAPGMFAAAMRLTSEFIMEMADIMAAGNGTNLIPAISAHTRKLSALIPQHRRYKKK